MPPEYRSVLIQRRLEDQPLSAMARRMGMSVSTLEKRLARAMYLLNEGLRAQEAAVATDENSTPSDSVVGGGKFR
jgi:RNA polymerase sigma-70 factor (ECF subfamily)